MTSNIREFYFNQHILSSFPSISINWLLHQYNSRKNVEKFTEMFCIQSDSKVYWISNNSDPVCKRLRQYLTVISPMEFERDCKEEDNELTIFLDTNLLPEDIDRVYKTIGMNAAISIFRLTLNVDDIKKRKDSNYIFNFITNFSNLSNNDVYVTHHNSEITQIFRMRLN